MTRTQIQFPDPLYRQLKETAQARDWSLAELLRRAAEAYLLTLPKAPEAETEWQFPTLPPNGEFLQEPSDYSAESEAIVEKYLQSV